LPSICRLKSLPEWIPLCNSALMFGSPPCPQIFDWGGSDWQCQNALAYYITAKVTAVKRFMVQASGKILNSFPILFVKYLSNPGVNVIKHVCITDTAAKKARGLSLCLSLSLLSLSLSHSFSLPFNLSLMFASDEDNVL